jgi:peptide chain release factor 3
LDNFSSENKQHIATDHDNDLVFLTRLQWDIDRVERDYPQIHLSATKEMMS